VHSYLVGAASFLVGGEVVEGYIPFPIHNCVPVRIIVQTHDDDTFYKCKIVLLWYGFRLCFVLA
jgi:hypothetical protein